MKPLYFYCLLTITLNWKSNGSENEILYKEELQQKQS